MRINRKKEIHLEAVFQEMKTLPSLKKVSNLVLMALQEDKKQMDCWNAFGKAEWNKAF